MKSEIMVLAKIVSPPRDVAVIPVKTFRDSAAATYGLNILDKESANVEKL